MDVFEECEGCVRRRALDHLARLAGGTTWRLFWGFISGLLLFIWESFEDYLQTIGGNYLKPIWKLFAEMKSEDLANIIDYRHLTDVLNKEEAIQILKQIESTKNNRIKNLNKEGYPSYVTSAGWLGYTDEKIKKLCIAASKKGFQHVKLKVGRNLKDDIRRISVVRETLGDEVKILLDANQVWEVDEAISWMRELSHFKPYFIEEPTSPDDIFGHKKIKDAIYPIKVATGEAVQNRIIFKQLIANGAIDIVQIDACRMGGVNEALAVQLIAKKSLQKLQERI